MFKGKMVTPAIPERVYLLYRAVCKEPLQNNVLKGNFEPAEQTTSYYSDVRTCAQELHLINVSDNIVSANTDLPPLKSIADFRVYVNSILYEFKDEPFWQTTNYIVNLDIRRVKTIDNIGSALTEEISTELGVLIDEMQLRAWRFWASFLGFGFVNGMSFIPNPAGFLQDIIHSSLLEKKKTYSMSDFIASLQPQIEIALTPKDMKDHFLNYSIANGFRTLHDLKYINITHGLDQGDIWTFYKLGNHVLNEANQIEVLKKDIL